MTAPLVAISVPCTRLGLALTVQACDLPGDWRDRGRLGAPEVMATRVRRSSFMSEAATRTQLGGGPGRGYSTHAATGRTHNLASPTRTERGYLVAVLSGGLAGTHATTLREQLLRMLRPAASRLVLDLSLVSNIDASGLAVLVGTQRRARLLGGSLRLAAVKPAVFMAVRAAGLDRVLEIYPTVQSAVSSPARN